MGFPILYYNFGKGNGLCDTKLCLSSTRMRLECAIGLYADMILLNRERNDQEIAGPGGVRGGANVCSNTTVRVRRNSSNRSRGEHFSEFYKIKTQIILSFARLRISFLFA